MLSLLFGILSVIFFYITWVIFCITRGVKNAHNKREINYTPEEFYLIGNPFSRYRGRSNW